MASYYRCFIDGFTRIEERHVKVACEEAMKTLKEKLTRAPVLAYSSFDKPFTVETDACMGLKQYYSSRKKTLNSILWLMPVRH